MTFNEFPFKKDEVNAFMYRMTDVVASLTHKQVKMVEKLDFKRKLLRS
jgi:hypothetical protein